MGGNNVNVTASKDINIKGSTVIADKDATLKAGNNVNIEAATNTSRQTSFTQKTESGFLSGGGLGITIEVEGDRLGGVGEAHVYVDTDEPGGYFLVTAHRAETTDDPARLASLMRALNDVIATYDMPMVASLHPRTADKLKEFGIDVGRVTFVPPMGLFDFVRLEKEAFCVLSDSGTVQEECCIFGVPTVTMRDVTERPETIECGSNLLAGTEPERIVPAVGLAVRSAGTWTPPAEYLATNVSDVVARIVLGIA